MGFDLVDEFLRLCNSVGVALLLIQVRSFGRKGIRVKELYGAMPHYFS
jgi:hypothetical protein